MVVSLGMLEAVTDSFGWVDGLGAHLVEEALERLGAVGVVVADRHRDDDARIELGDQRGRVGRRQRAAERDAGDVDRADVAELLLGQQVADVAEMDRVDAVDLDHERDLLAGLGAARVVAVGPDPGHQDFLDLVLARPVEHERVIEARRQQRLPVARGLERRLALALRQRSIVGMAEGHDVAADPAPRRSHHRLEWIDHHDRILPPQPYARPPIPSEFHRPILTQPTSPGTAARCRRPAVQKPRIGAPAAPRRRRRGAGGSERTSRCVSEHAEPTTHASASPARRRADRRHNKKTGGACPIGTSGLGREGWNLLGSSDAYAS